MYEELAKSHKVDKNDTANTVAYFDYIDNVLNSPKLEGKTDEGYWAAMKDLERDFITRWSKDALEYAKTSLIYGRELSPMYKTYRIDMINIGETIDFNGKSYWELPPSNTEEGRLARLQFRVNHPQVDAKLFTWGKVQTLMTQDAYDLANNRIQMLQMPKGLPLPLDRVQLDAAYKQAQANVDNIRSQIPLKTPMGIDVQKFANERSRYITELKALESRLPNALSQWQEDKILKDINDTLAKYDKLEMAIRGHAQGLTRTNLWMNWLLAEIEVDKLSQAQRRSRVASYK